MRRTLQIAGLLTLCVALITTLFLSVATKAAPGVNQTISFQGRLLDTQNNVVPDGYYNVQFKIYQDGTGATAGNQDGTLSWTETYTNNGGTNGVYVKNGYLSVDLGSKTPFGTSVDWNQDTLWLSMNIAGASAACTTFGESPCLADGEMLPMKRLTATPYSLNSAKLEGKSASDFIQNNTTQQTANFNISGNGIANTLQGNTSVITPLLDRADAGELTIGSVNASTISIGANPGVTQTINIGTGASSTETVGIGSTFGNSYTKIQGGNLGVQLESSGNINLATNSNFNFNNILGDSIFQVSSSNNTVNVALGSQLNVDGTAVFNQGLSIQGGALDVTAGINTSSEYSINGVGVLNNSGLSFSGEATSTVAAASGQNLQLTGTSVNIGDGTASGEPTLLTVDKSSTTPVTTGDAALGSMYYDTTLGKLQCYEADGWGACSNSPDTFVTLSPEYSNAVTNGTGVGSLTSDICSDSLNLNDGSSSQPTVCNTNETYNFYNWTSAETSLQTKSIFVTYKLPDNFKKFVSGSTSLTAQVSNLTNAGLNYQVYKNSGSGLVACGSIQEVTSANSWQEVSASGSADPANCSFAAGDSIVFKINLSAQLDANAYASTLGFAFSDN